MKHIKSYNENLNLNNTVIDFNNHLLDKGNKIAFILNTLSMSAKYPDVTDINFIGIDDKVDDMITYLTKTKIKTLWDADADDDVYYSDRNRTSIKIGRGVRKILDVAKPNLSYELTSVCKLSLLGNSNNGSWNLPGGSGDSLVLDMKNYDLDTILDNVIFFEKNNHFDKTKISVTIYNDDKEMTITSNNFRHRRYGYQRIVLDISKSDKKILEDDFGIEIINTNHPGYDQIFSNKFKINISTNLGVTDVDIEKYVNEFVALVKINKSDENSVLEVVNGKDIKYWYNDENYQAKLGKLGKSCMSDEESQSFFKIYTKNKKTVSLLILKNKDNKLLGRAILWKLKSGEYFLDRVYTINDSDENILINYAIKNDYMYRSSGTDISYYKKGVEVDDPKLEVKLEECDFTYYPYLDTMIYLDMNKKTLRNFEEEETFDSDIRELQEVDGSWD